MPKGGIIELMIQLADKHDLALTHLSGDGAQKYIRVSVRDTGSGMSDATLTKAIEPFYSPKSQGTGLGLSSVYGFATQSKGAMNIASSLGLGTTVTVFLPAVMASGVSNAKHD